MNLSTVTTASIATLKSFARANNLLPTGDLRLKSTWLEAVQTFLKAAQEIAQETVEGAAQLTQEIVTYDNAVIVANTLNVWTRKTLHFTYHAFVISCLLTIALGMSARDAWISFGEWLEAQSLTLRQPVAILLLATVDRRKHLKKVLRCTLQFQECRARSAIKYRVVQPAQEFRQRLNAARFVVTR